MKTLKTPKNGQKTNGCTSKYDQKAQPRDEQLTRLFDQRLAARWTAASLITAGEVDEIIHRGLERRLPEAALLNKLWVDCQAAMRSSMPWRERQIGLLVGEVRSQADIVVAVLKEQSNQAAEAKAAKAAKKARSRWTSTLRFLRIRRPEAPVVPVAQSASASSPEKEVPREKRKYTRRAVELVRMSSGKAQRRKPGRRPRVDKVR